MEAIVVKASFGKSYKFSGAIKCDNLILAPCSAFQLSGITEFSIILHNSNVDVPAFLVTTFKCDILSKSIENSGYEFKNADGFLMLLRISENQINPYEAIISILKNTATINRNSIGKKIQIISTPFSSIAFYNCVTVGTISNIIGYNDCLMLTDARLAPGCEGGLVNTLEGDAIGMVYQPIATFKGNWLGFTIILHLSPILTNILQKMDKIHENIHQPILKHTFGGMSIDSLGVVKIMCGVSSGSGIIINPNIGLVLTCSHVIQFKLHKHVCIKFKDKLYQGQVVYCNPDGVNYDVAIIKTSNPLNSTYIPRICKTKLNTGQAVYAVGFPSDITLTNKVTTSLGYILNVDTQHILITSCVTGGGFSGGPLFTSMGEIVGIVLSNIEDKVDHITYTQITFALPSTIFAQAVEEYQRTNDLSVLKTLICTDEDIELRWKLRNYNPRSKL